MVGKRTPGRILFNIINVILMIIIALCCIIPLWHVVIASISDPGMVEAHSGIILWPLGKPSINGYLYLGRYPKIWRGYAHTIFYVIAQCLISCVLVLLAGYVLSRKRFRYRNVISGFITFTMLFNGGMIPTYLVVKSYGLLDTIWAVILPGAVSTWNFIVMRSFFDNYPSEIEESGKVDGLTDAGVFFRLVLPTSKAVLATIGLYYAVSLWNAYFIPFIYLNDPDLFSLQLILHELLSAGSSNNATVGVGDVLVVEESLKYATVLVSIAPIMCVYPFLQKYFVKGVMIGAVKG